MIKKIELIILDPKTEHLTIFILIPIIIRDSKCYISYGWLLFLLGGGGGGGGGGVINGAILVIFLVWWTDPIHFEGISNLVPEIIPESAEHNEPI